MSAALDGFLKLLTTGKDGALLRYALGNEYLKAAQPALATEHLRRAVELDPAHSASWKLLGRALADCGDAMGARIAWTEGIGVAQRRGDQQAAREMGVFLKRLG